MACWLWCLGSQNLWQVFFCHVYSYLWEKRKMGTKAQICGHGDVIFHVKVCIETCRCHFQDVLHIPDLGYSLLLVSKEDLERFSATFGNECRVATKGKRTIVATCSRFSLYTVEELKEYLPPIVSNVALLRLWCERLLHAKEKKSCRCLSEVQFDVYHHFLHWERMNVPPVCFENRSEQNLRKTNPHSVHQRHSTFYTQTFSVQLRLCLPVDHCILYLSGTTALAVTIFPIQPN